MTLKLGNKRFWLAMIATAAIVVGFRELALVVCTWLGIPTAANIVGLPAWLSSSASTLLVDSGFAFLPVSAGAGILLFGLGEELLSVSVTIIISTLIPLWAFAKLSALWLGSSDIKNHRGGL